MAECLPPHPEPDLHLLTQSQTSTSVRSPPEQLNGEAERLGTGGLWCQDGPETEAGDQGPAAPDQRTRNPWLKELMEEAVLNALPGGGADGGPAWCRMSVLGPGLWLRRADGGAKTPEDDCEQESGGLTEKLYLWKANPEDNQDSTIKVSSGRHT
ncbi:unnamed protein product [Arctogadus glacialis]